MNEVEKLKLTAQQAAKARAVSMRSPEARAGYAAGVRALASLISACANVADQMRKENDNAAVDTMLQGYSASLRMLLKEADMLIPPGYEY